MKPFVGAFVKIKSDGDYLVTEVRDTRFWCIRHSPIRKGPYTMDYANHKFLEENEELVVTPSCLKFLSKYL